MYSRFFSVLPGGWLFGSRVGLAQPVETVPKADSVGDRRGRPLAPANIASKPYGQVDAEVNLPITLSPRSAS